MPTPLTTLPSKAALVTAAALLGAGGLTVSAAAIAAQGEARVDTVEVKDTDDDETTVDDETTLDDAELLETDAGNDAADAKAHAGEQNEASDHDHPENFGAIVSGDAQDGGVDGEEISRMARARAEARRAAADHGPGDAAGAGKADEVHGPADAADAAGDATGPDRDPQGAEHANEHAEDHAGGGDED